MTMATVVVQLPEFWEQGFGALALKSGANSSNSAQLRSVSTCTFAREFSILPVHVLPDASSSVTCLLM